MGDAPSFSVDTNLFRELGEFLVGRDSTALVELIKNAYDADATEVYVNAIGMRDPDRGSIVIRDNGIGMTLELFTKGFLRVASRMKETQDRRSLVLKRRYTGAKGIGRLAAHRLAHKLEILSVPDARLGTGSDLSLLASIDWDEVERSGTLDQLSARALVVNTEPKMPISSGGTVIELSNLRRAWTVTEIARFQAEMDAFRPYMVSVFEAGPLVQGAHEQGDHARSVACAWRPSRNYLRRVSPAVRSFRRPRTASLAGCERRTGPVAANGATRLTSIKGKSNPTASMRHSRIAHAPQPPRSLGAAGTEGDRRLSESCAGLADGEPGQRPLGPE